MKVVSVTRKGQVTIPEDVRVKLGIKEGTKLLVESIDKELALIKKVELLDSIEELQKYGRRLSKARGLTLREIEREIAKVRSEIWKEKYEKRYG